MTLNDYIELIIGQAIQKPNNTHVVMVDRKVDVDDLIVYISNKLSTLPYWLKPFSRIPTHNTFMFNSGSKIIVFNDVNNLRGLVVDTIGHYQTTGIHDIKVLTELHKRVKEVTVIKN